MFEKVIYEHLCGNSELTNLLKTYAGKPAVFNQFVPPDTDPLWENGPQYGRVVFSFGAQGNPARAMGGILDVDIMCETGVQEPESIEPIIRQLIDGYFFTDEGQTMAAQWETSRYFTERDSQVCGITISFTLLAFPFLSTVTADVTSAINEWTAKRFPDLLVINRDGLPAAWKPEGERCGVYWRVLTIRPANWIKDTHQTIYRTADLQCHIFAPEIDQAAILAQEITLWLYRDKQILSDDGGPIRVDCSNVIHTGADALREGQLTVEATYGEIVRYQPNNPLNHIHCS